MAIRISYVFSKAGQRGDQPITTTSMDDEPDIDRSIDQCSVYQLIDASLILKPRTIRHCALSPLSGRFVGPRRDVYVKMSMSRCIDCRRQTDRPQDNARQAGYEKRIFVGGSALPGKDGKFIFAHFVAARGEIGSADK